MSYILVVMSLVFLNLEQSSVLLPHDLDSFEEYSLSRNFAKCPSILGISPSEIHIHFCQEYFESVTVFLSVHHRGKHRMSFSSIPGGGKFYQLVKMASDKLPHSKVNCSVLIKKYLIIVCILLERSAFHPFYLYLYFDQHGPLDSYFIQYIKYITIFICVQGQVSIIGHQDPFKAGSCVLLTWLPYSFLSFCVNERFQDHHVFFVP